LLKLVFLNFRLIGAYPNTYTFTKAMAEYVTASESRVPTAIVRPSIGKSVIYQLKYSAFIIGFSVTPSLLEPYPGWVDNYSGLNGISSGVMRGTLRTQRSGKTLVADLVPVDLVANTLLVAAADLRSLRLMQSAFSLNWSTAENFPRTVILSLIKTIVRCFRSDEGVRVFNCTSGSSNPIRWGQIFKQLVRWSRETPSASVQQYPRMVMRSSETIDAAAAFFSHLLPALVADALRKLAGKKAL